MSGRKRSHDVEVDDSNNNLDYENRENGSHSDYDDDNDHRNNSKSKKKNKKNRPSKIMSESGQTDADRRLLRRKQRELHNDIAVGGDGAAAADDAADAAGGEQGGNDDGGVDELTRLRTQNNDLWRDVRYTREAVLDSENVDLIASKAARQAEKVVQVRFDFDEDFGFSWP
jgi:hypothetical protein